MNLAILIGRLTKDPEVRMTNSGMAVATFTVAIDRPTKDRQKQADFPKVTCFGKTAENVEKYVTKGSKVAVQGRIQTGSYENKDGQKVFTTDVVADRVEFLDSKSDTKEKPSAPVQTGFAALTEDIPF